MTLRKFSSKGWKLPIIAALGLTFALVKVLGHPTVPPKVPEATPPTSSYDKSVAGIGVIEPKGELITIGVELPGIVRNVRVVVGQGVKKGDLLFSLDTREVDAQIATLEASLAASAIQAEDAKAQFAIVNSIKDKRAIAKDDLNRRKYAYQLARAKVDEIKAQLAQAKTTKERLSIKAPAAGQILEVNVHPGEYASAGALPTPLIRMGDISTLHVRVEIDEENASRVRPENPASGMVRGDTTTSHPLTFVRFEPYIRPKQNLAVSGQRVDTRVLQAIYALPDGTPSLFVGQQMDVFIHEQQVEKK